MKCTSAQANKILMKLKDERENLLALERQSRTFIAATTENPEDARPAYDYMETQQKLEELERKIRGIKHAISAFNLSRVVEGFDMTVDQLLVYIPQLNERREKLARMANCLEKTRLTNSNRINLIEYQYANYDVAQARADYEAAGDELARAQLALDKLNTTDLLDIEL